MSLLVLEDESVEYAFLTLVLDGGSSDDPTGKGGLHSLLGNTLTCGAGHRDRVAFQEALDRIGGDCTLRTGRRHTFLEAEVLSRNVEPMLALLTDLLNDPRFEQSELETQQRIADAELSQVRDSDEELVAFLHGQFVWQGHVYGRSVRGDSQSVRGIEREDVVEAWAKVRERGLILLGASGHIQEDTLNNWSSEAVKLPSADPKRDVPNALSSNSWSGVEVQIIDRRDRNQAQIMWGQPSCNALHDDLYALRVANTAFGGTFTSTLMQEIREKRGWTYGAYSAIAADLTTGVFSMSYHVENANAFSAIELGYDLFKEWRGNGLSGEDMMKAKSYIVNSFPFTLETSQKRLERELTMFMLGRSADYLENYVSRIEAVSEEEIRGALSRHLSGDKMRLTVLGNASELGPALEAADWVNSVIVRPYDEPISEFLR